MKRVVTALRMNPNEKLDSIRTTSSSLLKLTSTQAPFIHSSEILKDLDFLEKEIRIILKKSRSLQLVVPQVLLQRWTIGSLRKALKKIKLSRKYSAHDDDRFIQQAQFAALWACQACSLAHTTSFVEKILNNIDHFTLQSPRFEKGDVVLSYKSNEYLNHDFISNIIAVLTGSHVTHALMVFDDSETQHLVSSSARSGLALKKISPKKGEMFIVLRYVSSINGIPKKNVIESMSSLYKRDVSFAELKSWMALMIGFVYAVTALLLERPVCLPNPIGGDFTLFCSEFVDDVFRRAGIYVSPRSEHSAVVGPVDLFYSPLLEFRGVIFRPEDKESLVKELSKTFTLPMQWN